MGLTPEQMVEELRRNNDALNRGEFDVAIELAARDIVLVRPGGLPEIRGIEAVRGWMEPDAFESQQIELLGSETSGSRVLTRQRMRARGAGSGIEMEGASWAVWIFDEDGRVTRMETYLEHDEEAARRSFRGTRD